MCVACKTTHMRTYDAARGTATERGYDAAHRQRFRAPVLARDPVCVICMTAPSTVADHYPRTRRELVRLGLDPNDPNYGRGLCGPCHSRWTTTDQGGGRWRGEGS
jgi:5-methylcytosine-specific restriction protein A